MSVIDTTTADIELDKAKKNIRQAIKRLSILVMDEPWGWETFSKEYQDELLQARTDLIKIIDSL